jgi:hypothetical protein
MRGLVLFLAVLAVIGTLSFADASIVKEKTEPKLTQFKTFTSAVCNNDGKVTRCRDELFVNCNGEISKAENIAECNGLKLDTIKPTGSAVFGKEWKDPRNI